MPSEINHGNVTPDIARHRGQPLRLGRDVSEQAVRRDRDGRIVTDRGERLLRDRDELPGGVTFDYAKHTAVLSLAALRKLHFPSGGGDVSAQARLVLAALGLFALTELRRSDYDLRSRCALVLDGMPTLFIVKRDGTTERFSFGEASATTLVIEALQMARNNNLVWRDQPVSLTPSAALVDLILQSRRLGVVDTDGDEQAQDEPSEEPGQEG